MTQTEALLTSLRDLWRKHPPPVPDDGDRLYYRYVLHSDTDPGWDDWQLVGVKCGKGVQFLQWTRAEEHYWLCETLLEQLQSGNRWGWLERGGLYLEWGLFHGDGPEGTRVEDWAGDGTE